MHRMTVIAIAPFLVSSFATAQQSSVPNETISTPTSTVVSVEGVPRFIRFSGTLSRPSSAAKVSVLFSLYQERDGHTPLWQEAQDVELDAQGRFTILLGSTRRDGLPRDLFVDGKAHWLGMQPQPGQGQETSQQPLDEEQRVLLVGVPYALKAADADTLGGRPASAFVLAPVQKKGKVSAANNAATGTATADENATPSAAISGTGAANYIPLWLNGSTLGNSLLFQHSGNVGIGTTSPASKFEVMSPTRPVALEGFNNAISGVTAGVLGVVSSKGGVAGVFNNEAGGRILSGRSNGVQVFSVDGTGNILASGGNLVGNNSTPILKVAQNGFDGSGIYASTVAGDGDAIDAVSNIGTAVFAAAADSGSFGVVGAQGCGDLQFCRSFLQGGNVPAAGVVGIAGVSYTVGVFAQADQQALVASQTDIASDAATIAAFTATAPTTNLIPVIQASGPTGGSCVMDNSGSLTCTGTKSAAVKVATGQQVALYAVESPENWFEDFGSAKLASGAGTVKLDPVFAETVNSSLDYHVFLTPKADCKGLYVAQETSTSFEVRELGGGQSSVTFDYRIVARRKGYESVRLADVTSKMKVPVRKPRSKEARHVASNR